MSEIVVGLGTAISEIEGVRSRDASDLASIGVHRVWQLLTHLPHRYEKLEPVSGMSELAADRIVAVSGEVTACRMAGFGRRGRFEAVLSDGSGRLDLVWFNASYLRNKIHAGHRLWVQGTVKRRGQALQMANPEFRVLGEDEEVGGGDDEGPSWRPVYPAGERITSRRVGVVAKRVLPHVLDALEDHLDQQRLARLKMPGLGAAYRLVHFPEREDDAARGRRRLAFDELLMLQLAIGRLRVERGASRAAVIDVGEELDGRIRARLPFEMTGAQSRVVGEICADLARATPANRLVQGDVGSGKTAVAAYAMLAVAAAGMQSVLVAPTTLLAEQHFAGLSSLLEGAKVSPRLLTGSTEADERASIESGLRSGEVKLLVATHAVLSERVEFAALALSIMDEQHRFGVRQRAGVREKGMAPHSIVMTATPIPRTVAMGLFGDMDISIIDEAPAGRRGVATRVVGDDEREKVYGYVRERIEKGEQAYVVAPSVGSASIASAEGLLAELGDGWFAGLRLGLMHGRMDLESRGRVMGAFRRGELDVLVATTVIEVGVDVPNATLMVIEGADRFGLAQLHQLRGRVARGGVRGLCVGVAAREVVESSDRLRAFASTSDGFEIAELDYGLRGAGQLAGTRQAGASSLSVADLDEDRDLLRLAREEAKDMLEHDPALDRAPLLLRRLERRIGLGGEFADTA